MIQVEDNKDILDALKSNMDRFIVQTAITHIRLLRPLKSNMDRFID